MVRGRRGGGVIGSLLMWASVLHLGCGEGVWRRRLCAERGIRSFPGEEELSEVGSVSGRVVLRLPSAVTAWCPTSRQRHGALEALQPPLGLGCHRPLSLLFQLSPVSRAPHFLGSLPRVPRRNCRR